MSLRVFIRKSFCKYYQSICGRFYFSKIPSFQHILLNIFGRIRLKYENYSLRCILFQTLKKNSQTTKSLIAKTFDGNTFKMKVISPVQVVKNKKQCFQLCLDRMYTMVLTTHVLSARSDTQVKLRARKVGCLERILSTPDKSLTTFNFNEHFN